MERVEGRGRERATAGPNPLGRPGPRPADCAALQGVRVRRGSESPVLVTAERVQTFRILPA